jgi:hypothetical protein
MQKFVQSTVVPPFTLGPTGILGNTGVEAGFGSTGASGNPTVTGGGTAPLTTDHNSNASRNINIESAIPSDDPTPWPKPTDSQGPYST